MWPSNQEDNYDADLSYLLLEDVSVPLVHIIVVNYSIPFLLWDEGGRVMWQFVPVFADQQCCLCRGWGSM